MYVDNFLTKETLESLQETFLNINYGEVKNPENGNKEMKIYIKLEDPGDPIDLISSSSSDSDLEIDEGMKKKRKRKTTKRRKSTKRRKTTKKRKSTKRKTKRRKNKRK